MTSQVTLNGETFIEPTDFENYGFRVKFFSLIRAWLADAGKAMVTTSASSFAIGTGSKDFILAEDRPFASGAWITATDSANSANYMFGQVTGYVAGTKTLTVNVTATGGSGTKTAWNIQLSGIQGAAGGVADGSVTEVKQSLSDVTTHNASTSAHGYLKKLSNVPTEFMNGVGDWAVPPSFSGLLPHRSGAYYPPSNAIGLATTAISVSADEIQAFPFIVPVATTYTRLSIHVTSAGTNNMRLGIYSDSAGIPSALVLDAGTVSVSSIGDKEITISQTLSAGVYWLVFLAESNGSQIRAFAANTHSNIVGGNDLTGGFYPALRRASFTYAPLPNPFGGTPAGSGNNVAMICLRV